MEKISAVIITYNAERMLNACLKALQQVADEIIVVDNFSTDATAGICKQHNVNFFTNAWPGFGPQKNFGISKTQYNYILSIDADEVLDDELIKSINEKKAQGLSGVYQVLFSHYYYNAFVHHGAEGNDYKNRLFDKRFIKWDDKEVHESLIFPENVVKQKLAGHVLHYSYTSIAHHIDKANGYTTQSAIELNKKGKTNYLFKMIFSPPINFFVIYFLKRGFLDGINGFVLAVFSAHASFVKNAKLWEMIKKKKI